VHPHSLRYGGDVTCRPELVGEACSRAVEKAGGLLNDFQLRSRFHFLSLSLVLLVVVLVIGIAGAACGVQIASEIVIVIRGRCLNLNSRGFGRYLEGRSATLESELPCTSHG
jgi:hypothetical protein